MTSITKIDGMRRTLEPSELSSIGFGCYRISTLTPHERALGAALARGCNLFDTASTYSGGRSELAIGRVLAAWDGQEPFVVTKAGYCEVGEAPAGMTVASDGTTHCIAPDFLRQRLRTSTERLGRPPDAFLLHNPEYHVQPESGDGSDGAFFRRLVEAFAFLEEQADAGAIRFYGVSSNLLGLARCSPVVSFEAVFDAARSVSPRPRFKFIQFPLNLFESAAAGHGAGPSLIETARDAGVVSLANRPLNAVSGGVTRRIATYDRIVDPAAVPTGASVAHLRDLLAEALSASLTAEQIAEVPAIRFLDSLWRDCTDPEAVEYVLAHFVDPLAQALYGGGGRKAYAAARTEARGEMMTEVLRRLTLQGFALREEFETSGRLPRDDGSSLAFAACREYLRQGVDHLLVGMRKQAYVEELAPLFFFRPAEPSPSRAASPPVRRRAVGANARSSSAAASP
jgi:aryl-alcohol dehydrogenase-like predicted oxidoreductase